MLKNKLIISLIGFYIFWLAILPNVITKTFEVLCQNFSKNSQYEIQVVKPRTSFSILPTATFKVQEIILKTKNNATASQIENFKLKVRLLPLISGKVHINTMEIDKVKLSATLVDDLVLDKDFFNKLNDVSIELDSLKIGKFEALFYQEDVKNPIKYNGENFNYQRKNRYIKLQNNSVLNVNGNISKVISNLYLPKNNDINKTIFDLDIENVNLTPLKEYFKHYLPKDLKNLEGTISVQATKDGLIIKLNNCAINMTDSAKSLIFPKNMQVISKFDISKNQIRFENIDINSEKVHVSLDGKICNYFGKIKPTLDLNVRIDKSRIEDIISLLPVFKVEEIDVYELKKYKFYGDILANFSVKGRLPEPDIYGDIYLDDGVLVSRIPNTSKGAIIKLNFAGKQANFDVIVPTGGLEKVFVKGSQEIYNVKYADFIVKSTKNVDLKIAQSVLNPLHKVLNFIIGPVPIMDINGKGNIDIKVKGNRKNPHIWGTFNVVNASGKFNDAKDFVLEEIDALLRFNDQKVSFETTKAKLNNKDTSIVGVSDLYGKFDFDIISKEQPVEKLYSGIKTCTMIPEIQKMLPKLDTMAGLIDFEVKVYGAIKNLNDIVFNKNIFAKGEILLRNNSFIFQNIGIDNTNGNLKFDNLNIDSDITAQISNLPLSIKAKIKNGLADLLLDIPKLNPNCLISNEETGNKQFLPYVSVKGKYSGNIYNIDFTKLNMNARILGSIPSSKIKYASNGEINIQNGKILIKGIKGFINNPLNSFEMELSAIEAFSKTPCFNGLIKLKTPNLNTYNEILNSDLIPVAIRNYTKDYEFNNGKLDMNLKVANNKLSTFVDLSGVSFNYLPLGMPVEIINGSISANNNILKLNKINMLADNMPILADGEIKDIFGRQNFNMYFNSKPRQDFIDKYINKNQIYPIKIKGDIVYWVKVKGIPENYDLKTEIDMSKDSSFYHFGATIGDIENAISVSIDSKITEGNNHKIREFCYDKIIDSQSGRQTRLNMLKAFGGVQILKDDLIFDNLQIKTSHPTDARIFNIIFRKPNIKQGQFTSDLKINGRLSNPKVLGDFHIFETNIPFLDTTMKNIELVFKDKIIEFDTIGEVMGNDIIFNGILKNKLTPPYKVEEANFYTKYLDLNQIVNKIKTSEVDNVSTFESFENFDINSIITDKFKLKADNIVLRNIHATNFEAITSLNEKRIFDVSNFKFNIAQGLLNGIYSYNLKNNDMNVALQAEKISANDLTWALFDLNNQIYGDLTGNINLSCEGSEFNRCMETLSGNTVFNVKDGRMPKLGSLEYLLKAGNLVKGGLTGVSINGVIDLLAPSKTGDFEDIFGSIRIKDGVARNIEITTKGDDLSMFIGGTYNFATSIADMEVLGLLSRKISTMFGPIGNLSINTLFNVIPGVDLSKDSLVLERINKIPGIELSSKEFRKFIAEIKGNINGDDYVTSFKWIN